MSSALRRPAVALLAASLAATVLGVAPAHAVAGTGTISGLVSGADGPLSYVGVDLYQYEDGSWVNTYQDISTNEDGVYSADVPAGDYRVRFDNYYDQYAFEFYRDAATVEEGQTVTVPDGGLVEADAVLDAAGHVSGTVTDPDGAPVPDALVEAYQVVGTGADTDYSYTYFATTDENGVYDLGGLRDGTYVIKFEDLFGTDVRTWATEYSADKPNEYVADPVAVVGGATVDNIDAQLEPDSVVSGTMTDQAGNPLNGSVVALVDVDGQWRDVAYADVVDGSYTLSGLAADTYRLQFDTEIDGRYVYEYWNNAGDIDTAQDVVLGVDEEKLDVDAVMVPGEHDPVYTPVVNLTPPVVSGTPQVGSPLTGSSGTWSPTPSHLEYYWVSGEELLQGGTSATYTPTAADLGKTITVYVYASADGYDDGYSSAVASGPVVAAPVVTPPVVTPPVVTPPAPVVSTPAALAAIVEGIDVAGKPKVGSTLRLTGLDKLFRASTPVSYRFQWYAGSKKIKKATKSKLKVLSSMKGSKLSVKVTASAGSSTKTVKIKVGKVR